MEPLSSYKPLNQQNYGSNKNKSKKNVAGCQHGAAFATSVVGCSPIGLESGARTRGRFKEES